MEKRCSRRRSRRWRRTCCACVVQRGHRQGRAGGHEFIWGKTGTTENYGDAWFVGGNADMTVAIWVGYADKLQPMEYEHAGGPVAGGTFPAEIFHDFMTSWLQLRQARRLERAANKQEDGTAPTWRPPCRWRRPKCRRPRPPRSTAGHRRGHAATAAAAARRRPEPGTAAGPAARRAGARARASRSRPAADRRRWRRRDARYRLATPLSRAPRAHAPAGHGPRHVARVRVAEAPGQLHGPRDADALADHHARLTRPRLAREQLDRAVDQRACR